MGRGENNGAGSSSTEIAAEEIRYGVTPRRSESSYPTYQPSSIYARLTSLGVDQAVLDFNSTGWEIDYYCSFLDKEGKRIELDTATENELTEELVEITARALQEHRPDYDSEDGSQTEVVFNPATGETKFGFSRYVEKDAAQPFSLKVGEFDPEEVEAYASGKRKVDPREWVPPAAARAAQLRCLCKDLEDAGVERAICSIEGSGDSGYIDSVTLTRRSGSEEEGEIVRDPSLEDRVADLVASETSANCMGWENNEGGHGSAALDVAEQKLEADFYSRYGDSEPEPFTLKDLPGDQKFTKADPQLDLEQAGSAQ